MHGQQNDKYTEMNGQQNGKMKLCNWRPLRENIPEYAIAYLCIHGLY
jgi:hypothetical protein